MARTSTKILAIARIALQETLRRKVLYIIGILFLLALFIVGSGMVVLQMATQAGELQAASSMKTQFVQVILGMWGVGALFLAVFLGAVGISSEINGKTIVNVLSRPVERTAYLTGRWLGTSIFLLGFQILGVLFALLIARIFDVPISQTVWLGFVEMFIDILFFSGVSLSLSVLMPPVPAGACAVLLSMLPTLVSSLLKNPRWIVRLPAAAVYYAGPSKMPVNLISDGFSKQVLNPDYALYLQVLAENLLYAIAVFVIGCIVFSRRELRLR